MQEDDLGGLNLNEQEIEIQRMLAEQLFNNNKTKKKRINEDDPKIKSMLDNETKQISTIFENIDPKFVRETLVKYIDAEDRMNHVIGYIAEMKEGYPKKVISEDEEEEEEEKQDYHDSTSEVSLEYKQRAFTYLIQQFPKVHPAELEKVLAKFNHHLTPALEYLDENYSLVDGLVKIGDSESKVLELPLAYNFNDNPCKEFEDELKVCGEEHELFREREKEKLLVEREGGEPTVCPVCMFDKVMSEMCQCTEGHLICKECLKEQLESNIAHGTAGAGCVEVDCPGFYSERFIEMVLSKKQQRLLDSISVNQEVANVLKRDCKDTVVFCPFCDYFAIVDNPNDTEFHCKNPSCMKVSCRKCGKESHLPQKCAKELEKGEEDLRKFVEQRMSEAYIRYCPECAKPIVKIEGCNLLTCTCGAHMCHICKKHLSRDKHTAYQHFIDPPGTRHTVPVPGESGKKGCQLWENSPEEDKIRVKKARLEAEAEWRKAHPDFKDVKLNVKE